MATNPFFRHNVRSEQNLYEDLIIEAIQMYGVDVYYIPREVVHRDMIFDDSILSRFKHAYKVETYIESIEGFEGDGDLFQKFGVEIRDAVSFIMSRRRWNTEIRQYQELEAGTADRPNLRIQGSQSTSGRNLDYPRRRCFHDRNVGIQEEGCRSAKERLQGRLRRHQRCHVCGTKSTLG